MAREQDGGHRFPFKLLLSIVAGLVLHVSAARVAGGGRQLLQSAAVAPVSLPPLVTALTNSAGNVGCFNSTHLQRTGTVLAVQVPQASLLLDTTLQLGALAADYPNPRSRQTFQALGVTNLTAALQGLPGFQQLLQLLQGDVAYRFQNTVSGKCWDDGGGQSTTTLRQAQCATSLGDVLNVQAAIRQLFQVIPGPTLPGCNATGTGTGDKAYQIRSLSSLLLTSTVQGNVAGTCLTDGVTVPSFYACAADPTLVPVQQFVLTFKPFA